jgi:plastocyanin
MHRAWILALLLAASPQPGHAQVAGSIDGTVTLSRELAARRPRFRIYADAGKGATPTPAPPADLRAENANVVVYLETDGAKALARGPARQPDRASMTQKDERFIPHVLPILRGATVEFPNEDDIFHNVFSLSGARRFDLPKYPAGSSRSVTFPREGVVKPVRKRVTVIAGQATTVTFNIPLPQPNP